MKKQYVQILIVLLLVVGISTIVVLNVTKSVSLVLESNTKITANEEQSNAQTTSSDGIETIDDKSDVTTMDEESLRTFAQNLSVPLQDIISFDFSSGEYSWVNGYDESMMSYYETIIQLNTKQTKEELAEYINAVARGNYSKEVFRIKVLEKEGLSIVNWNDDKSFEYLPGYSRYSVAELYYKKFPEKKEVDTDSYYLENALQ